MFNDRLEVHNNKMVKYNILGTPTLHNYIANLHYLES